MLIFLSEIINSKIILFQEQALSGEVGDYLIDHEKGKLIGLFTFHPLEKKIKFVPTGEIKGIGADQIIISDLNSLVDIEDVVRAKRAKETDAKIVGETVETEMGRRIGKVREAAFEVESLSIKRLYVSPQVGLKNFAKELIIPSEKIIEIQKKENNY